MKGISKFLPIFVVLAMALSAFSVNAVYASGSQSVNTSSVTGGGWIESHAGAYVKHEIEYSNGFETNTDGWYSIDGSPSPKRVISGTDNIQAASGNYYAQATKDYTKWGGYNDTFPAGGYITSLDIYLNVNGGFENDTRFDWSSAISTPDGGFRRDFVFNAGFYNDDSGLGAGTNRFVVSASNNAGRADSYPKNPGRDPIAITTTGWYTFQHHFYDGGNGVLDVDLSIIDPNGNILHTWTLSDPSDIIGSTVGGNRYGWFASNEFPFLAIDNSYRVDVSEPTGKATFGFVAQPGTSDGSYSGNLEFSFPAANLDFHSTSFSSLNFDNNIAEIQGSGTINGENTPSGETYHFTAWTGDKAGANGADTFRIQIWYGSGSHMVVVYDNGSDQAIGGGSIVIH
jgi:hypothetical protein